MRVVESCGCVYTTKSHNTINVDIEKLCTTHIEQFCSTLLEQLLDAKIVQKGKKE